MEKPTGWYKGEAGGYVTEYSDTLLIFLLKALRPEKFRERVEVQSVPKINLDLLPHSAIQRIADGEHILSVLVSLLDQGHDLAGVLEPAEDPSKEIVQR